MERASMRLASRCASGRSIRPHRCAAFAKRCRTIWSDRVAAAAAARKSHACALHARTSCLARAR
eukprot:8231233-Lingulodinium_polyedra.AAC.1